MSKDCGQDIVLDVCRDRWETCVLYYSIRLCYIRLTPVAAVKPVDRVLQSCCTCNIKG